MDPWSESTVITPSESLINLFQEWNKTKSSENRLVSYNRAKQWISRLLKKSVSIPQGHRMRQEDLQNALDHMIDAHSCGVTQLEYLKSCLAPMRSDKSDILTNNDSIDLHSKWLRPNHCS